MCRRVGECVEGVESAVRGVWCNVRMGCGFGAGVCVWDAVWVRVYGVCGMLYVEV